MGMIPDLIRKLDEHARRFAGLPLTSVPWVPTPEGHPDTDDFAGDMAYMRDLVDEFLTTARTTANGVVCPLIESMLDQPEGGVSA